jgi:hypothetical protein
LVYGLMGWDDGCSARGRAVAAVKKRLRVMGMKLPLGGQGG